MSKKLGFFLLVAAIAFAMSTMVASAAGVKTNSNETGTLGQNGSLSKALEGHTVHGNYKNNTNSCASCHQTHTASSTTNLLFKSSADEACEACHDASLGIYNVEDHVSQGAGTFGLTADYNGSMHNVDGGKTLAAAPGARGGVGELEADEWDSAFGCESCHNPHGSYSSRLLNVSPLNTITTAYGSAPNLIPGVTRVYKRANDNTLVKGTVSDDVYTAFGNQWNGITILGSYAAPFTTANVIAALPAGKLHTPGKEVAAAYVKVQAADLTTGGQYKGSGLSDGDVIVQLYRFSYGTTGSSATWKKTPVLTTASKKMSLLIGASQAVQGGTSTDNANVIQVNPVLGYYKPAAAQQGATELNKVTLPLIVGMTLKTLPGAPSTNGVVEKVTDEDLTYGGTNKAGVIGYSEWCGTCHTDYFAYTKTGTGWDSDMYHHNVADTKNGRNCGYCHFAHGTDVTIMKDALGRTVDQIASADFLGNQTSAMNWLKDVNKSSALKRFTNMTVCYGCHSSSHYGAMGNNGSTGVGSPGGLDNGIKPSTQW